MVPNGRSKMPLAQEPAEDFLVKYEQLKEQKVT